MEVNGKGDQSEIKSVLSLPRPGLLKGDKLVAPLRGVLDWFLTAVLGIGPFPQLFGEADAHFLLPDLPDMSL